MHGGGGGDGGGGGGIRVQIEFVGNVGKGCSFEDLDADGNMILKRILTLYLLTWRIW